MKIQRTKCDWCGRERDIGNFVIEARKVVSVYRNQIERDAPEFAIEPCSPVWTYDFCELRCLSEWATKEAADPGSETAPR